MTIEIRDASLEARIQKHNIVEQVLLRLLDNRKNKTAGSLKYGLA